MRTTPLSAGNPRIKDLRRLSRRSERSERRLFLVEGRNGVEAALQAGCVEEVLASADADLGWVGEQVRVTRVEARALGALSDAVSPAGPVAVCRMVDVDLAAALRGDLVVICADVRDPGNAGTVIRCADAAGAAGVVLAGHAVDVHNPKTLRASAGSVFHLPVAVETDPAAAVRAARAAGHVVLAADGDGEVGLYDIPRDRPTAWLLGNEAWGLPTDLATLADHRVAIPIRGRAESLNLATAAALCLYESTRPHPPDPSARP